VIFVENGGSLETTSVMHTTKQNVFFSPTFNAFVPSLEKQSKKSAPAPAASAPEKSLKSASFFLIENGRAAIKPSPQPQKNFKASARLAFFVNLIICTS